MGEDVEGLQTLEARIQHEFKGWPKDAISKLKVEIESTKTGRLEVSIEKNTEEGEEGAVFRAQYDTRFPVGTFRTDEEAQSASLQVQSILAKLG